MFSRSVQSFEKIYISLMKKLMNRKIAAKYLIWNYSRELDFFFAYEWFFRLYFD